MSRIYSARLKLRFLPSYLASTFQCSSCQKTSKYREYSVDFLTRRTLKSLAISALKTAISTALSINIIFFSILFLAFDVSAETMSEISPTSKATPVSHNTSTKHNLKPHKKNKNQNQFPMQRTATGNRVFIFSPRVHAWAIYDENGERIKTGRASGGRSFCRDIRRQCRTIVGTFSVISKGGATCKSKKYPIRTNGGAPMPYCMRFTESGYAIHGSSSVPNYNASHGCIRVPPSDAKWLSQNFVQHGTTVIVLPY